MASPTVNALNNEPAIMRVGTQDVFFKTTTQTDAVTGRILQTTVEPQAITEGVVLSVTPQIAGDGMINMSITPSLTERTGQATSRFGDTAPILSVREADTLVRVHENETIVIAGLMDERMRREVREGAVPRRSAGRRSDVSRRDDEPAENRSRDSADADHHDARARRAARAAEAQSSVNRVRSKPCTRNITGSRKSRSA